METTGEKRFMESFAFDVEVSCFDVEYAGCMKFLYHWGEKWRSDDLEKSSFRETFGIVVKMTHGSIDFPTIMIESAWKREERMKP